jgi:hypothetical protein
MGLLGTEPSIDSTGMGNAVNLLPSIFPHETAFDGVWLEPPLRCDEEPLNNDCQMKASLRSNSMSFSVQSLVGKACRNIMTS